jgi:hypothetical protein
MARRITIKPYWGPVGGWCSARAVSHSSPSIPYVSAGFERFTNPQNPIQMLMLSETKISTQYHQLSPAAISGDCRFCKALLAADDKAKALHQSERVLDVDFIAEHTDGYGTFEAAVRAFDWPEIERCSGLT